MRRLVLITLAAALGAAPAQAVTKNDVVTASVRKTGRSGTALVYKGTVNSRVFGRGTVVEKVYPDLTGTFVITYAKGKTMGRSTARTRPSSGDRIRVSGTYRLTGGTGRYKNVRGKGTFTGSSNRDLSRATFRQEGKVSY